LQKTSELLQLGFFVFDVLTCDGIELFDDELFAHRLLVLGRRVEMAGASGRFEFDFFTHDLSPFELDGAFSAKICEHCIDTVFINQADRSGGEAQTHEAVLALNPEAAALQIREETAFGFVVSVRNVVSHHRLFAGDLTYAGHDWHSFARAHRTTRRRG
jgi:hypothetical protein